MNWRESWEWNWEYLWGLRRDKVLELQELISFGIFKTIIGNPSDIEFKLRPGNSNVAVYDKWEFICYIKKDDYHQIVDEDSIVNTHFDTIKKIL